MTYTVTEDFLDGLSNLNKDPMNVIFETMIIYARERNRD